MLFQLSSACILAVFACQNSQDLNQPPIRFNYTDFLLGEDRQHLAGTAASGKAFKPP
jgi:hypothetical protein